MKLIIQFKKTIFYFILTGYIAFAILMAVAYYQNIIFDDILMYIRLIVFTVSPVMLKYIDIRKITTNEFENRTDIIASNKKIAIFMIISFIIMYLSAYVFLILEIFEITDNVASVAGLVGSSAFLGAIYTTKRKVQ